MGFANEYSNNIGQDTFNTLLNNVFIGFSKNKIKLCTYIKKNTNYHDEFVCEYQWIINKYIFFFLKKIECQYSWLNIKYTLTYVLRVLISWIHVLIKLFTLIVAFLQFTYE